jgi:hypothetical protein
MDDSDADGIWEVTLALGGNTTYQYKFVNGTIWGFDEIIPGECATDGNRTLSVETSDITTEAFCFGSCAACATGIDDLARDHSFSIYPNPSDGQFEVALHMAAAGEVLIQVYAVTGQLVSSRELFLSAGSNKEVFVLDEKGIYFVEISSDEGQSFRKLVIH